MTARAHCPDRCECSKAANRGAAMAGGRRGDVNVVAAVIRCDQEVSTERGERNAVSVGPIDLAEDRAEPGDPAQSNTGLNARSWM